MMPTQSASHGAKTTSPSPVVVAPLNLWSNSRVDEMLTQLKKSVVGSKWPTQSAFHGAKTAIPLLAVLAPENFQPLLMVEEMSMHLKASVIGS